MFIDWWNYSKPVMSVLVDRLVQQYIDCTICGKLDTFPPMVREPVCETEFNSNGVK